MTKELEGQARLVLERALRAEERLPRDRDKVWQGVLAGLAVGSPAELELDGLAGEASAPVQSSVASGAPSGLGSLGSSVWKMASVKWLSVLAVGASLTYSVAELSRSEPHAAPRASSTVEAPSVAATAPQPPRADAPPLPLETPPVARGEVARATPARAERGPRRSQSRREAVVVEAAPAVPAPAATSSSTAAEPIVAAPESAPAPSLAQELAAVRKAQEAMLAGDARRALSIVRGSAGRSLMAERVALEVFALCELGEVEQASERARAFFALAPTSPLAPRVARSCARR
jgi:hypothetical protein